MTLEFRVQHDVATDASPAPTRSDRTGLRGFLGRLAERRAAARVRRVEARLQELGELEHLLSEARGVVERGWIQHAWFAYLDEHGRTRNATSAAAMDVQGRPLVAACLVGAVVSAAGGFFSAVRNGNENVLPIATTSAAAAAYRAIFRRPLPALTRCITAMRWRTQNVSGFSAWLQEASDRSLRSRRS